MLRVRLLIIMSACWPSPVPRCACTCQLQAMGERSPTSVHSLSVIFPVDETTILWTHHSRALCSQSIENRSDNSIQLQRPACVCGYVSATCPIHTIYEPNTYVFGHISAILNASLSLVPFYVLTLVHEDKSTIDMFANFNIEMLNCYWAVAQHTLRLSRSST